MHSRRALAATIVALIALSGARVVDAVASPTPGDPPGLVVHPPVPPRPPVSEPGPPPEPALGQTVQLSIVGGDLELETTTTDVVLTRVPGSDRAWVGPLSPVRVVDARGVPDGWEVRWTVEAVDIDGEAAGRGRGLQVRVAPGEPSVICCEQDSVYAGRPLPARPGGRPLFGAEDGTGGGTFEVAGSVTAKLPPSIEAAHVVVRLSFALH